MEYITTTELRTKSSALVDALAKGNSVLLIHHSKVIAEIKPTKNLTKTDITQLKKLAESLNLPKTSYKERERIYRKHLEEKYGKGIS